MTMVLWAGTRVILHVTLLGDLLAANAASLALVAY